ncbi:alpha/beta hydrolase [Streptomyces sp. DSM 44917]|uniref:Alpha/beta hydrolase n=1 Tax=Streptomyces boetiae TaxID=3075541 RepID=A0ABU2LGL0_9ACTN|nr:alpha/beta hydrolase [Streptomyces sp. DSM 44917]MDT0310298.1 alpha/beta hydrolase [Streptomyces sp. DSM 44917]
MLTVSQLQDVPVDWMNGVATAWSRAGRDAEETRDLISQSMLPELTGGRGNTVETATASLHLIAENCEYARQQCALVSTAVQSLTDRMTHHMRELRRVLAEAEAAGYEVGDDGSVSYPATTGPSGEDPPPLPLLPPQEQTSYAAGTAHPSPLPDYFAGTLISGDGPHAQAAQILANRIGRVLRQAQETDEEIEAALQELDTHATLRVDDRDWADAQSDAGAVADATGAEADSLIPQDDSPAQNREWWDSLSREEQVSMIALFPAEIGALDGLPSEARDQANRAVLRTELARVSDERARVIGELSDLGIDGHDLEFSDFLNPRTADRLAEAERLNAQLNGLQTVQARLDNADAVNGLPEAYLLGIGLDGQEGRFILANGNPDTADHTAVYVPGTGAGLATSADTEIRRVNDLWRESAAAAPGENVSTIAWVGYEAPDNAIPFSGGDLLIPDAAQESYARDAAPLLRGFAEGLEAAQGGPESSHTTLVGHSYGSTVIGAATQESGGSIADDIIVAGSPGMLVEHAEELGVGSDHVWSMAAPIMADPSLPIESESEWVEVFGMPVPDLNMPSIDWPTVGDIVPLAGAGFLGGGGFEWERSSLGLPVLDFNTPAVPSMESFGANILATDSTDHSGYWDPGSLSLTNQAGVITGQMDLVEEE